VIMNFFASSVAPQLLFPCLVFEFQSVKLKRPLQIGVVGSGRL
jgi:hypothetical protein